MQGHLAGVPHHPHRAPLRAVPELSRTAAGTLHRSVFCIRRSDVLIVVFYFMNFHSVNIQY